MTRIRVLMVAAMCLPATVVAQQPPAPAQQPAKLIVQSFRDFGGHYGGWLLAAFDSIPESKYGFRPTPPQQSVGFIAQHLEHANYVLCERIGGMQHPTGPKDSLADTIKATWPKDTLVARLRASLQFCGEAVAHLNDATLTDAVPAGPPGSNQTSPRVRALLYLVTDLAEHYSQLASYMRLMGMVPPSALPHTNR